MCSVARGSGVAGVIDADRFDQVMKELTMKTPSFIPVQA
jgi:hypothetical protein